MAEAGRNGHHWDMETSSVAIEQDVVVEPGPRVIGVALDLAVARREAWQLPVLRDSRPAPRLPSTWEGVCLRLQAAVWEVAARADIPVRPGTSIDAVARLLVGHGAIIPPAGDAVRALARVANAACAGDGSVVGAPVAEAARLADRLAAHLALRARFG